MAKPKRTFSADVGQKSTGTAGPDQIEYDLDNLFAALDPADTFKDGSPGGIQTENIRAGAATDTIIGTRTVDQALAGDAHTGTLTQLLSWLAKHIKAVKGTANWYDAAASSIAGIWAKFNAATGHKHTGAADDAPQIGADGLADGAATDAKVGSRTVDQAQAPVGNTGTLTQLFSWLANRVKAITGATNWYDTPATSLANAKAHMDAAAPHSGHETPAGAQAKVDAHANRTDNPHGTTAAQTGALVSIKGVSNPGGNVDLVAGTGITITPDTTNKRVTITATGEALPAPHAGSHAVGGTDVLTPDAIGAETPAGAQAKADAVQANLTAHLAETVITANKTINVPADYPTIQAALDSLKKAWIPRDVTVTIQVAAGTYSHTSPIIVDHPQGLHIKIIGATPVTTTITGAGTITGSAGNWGVPILVQSTSGIAAGDYVIVRDTTGTGDHYAFRGIWKVISVDSATQITVQNTHRASAFPTATLSGGTVVVLKTVLKFVGCRGIVVAPNSALGLLGAVAVVGDGSTNEGILVGRLPSDLGVPGPAFILLGGNVGINGFGSNGIWVGYGGTVFAGSSTASGNGQNGFLADTGGFIWAISSTASGNGQNGFLAANGSSIVADSSTASGNGANGFWATNGSSIAAGSSTASGNTNSDYYAWLESSIYVYGYTGAPIFSPAVNTVGNANAIIST
ncbi:MAG: right-handed parallel beta-helix repeat-containing protein [Bacillota bacterium]